MAAGAWGLVGRLFWSRVGDQLAVAHGVVVDGKLEDPVEQQAAASRAAAVEAEHTLVDSFELGGEESGQAWCPVWRT